MSSRRIPAGRQAAGTGDIANARDMIGRLKALDPASDWSNLASTLPVRLDTENPASALDTPPATTP